MKKKSRFIPAPQAAEYVPVPGDFGLLEQDDIATDTNYASQGYWKGVAVHFMLKNALRSDGTEDVEVRTCCKITACHGKVLDSHEVL